MSGEIERSLDTRREFLRDTAIRAGALAAAYLGINPADSAVAQAYQALSHPEENDPGKNIVTAETHLPSSIYDYLSSRVEHYRQFISKSTLFFDVPDSHESSPDRAGYLNTMAYASRNYVLNDRIRAHVVDHVLNYGLLDNYREQNGQRDPKFILIKSLAANYPQEVESRTPGATNPCKPQYAAVFKLFDESNHLNIDCNLGHPASNYQELFASALTSMIHFEDELVDGIAGLRQEPRTWATDVIKTIIATTDKMSARARAPQKFIDNDSPLRNIQNGTVIVS